MIHYNTYSIKVKIKILLNKFTSIKIKWWLSWMGDWKLNLMASTLGSILFSCFISPGWLAIILTARRDRYLSIEWSIFKADDRYESERGSLKFAKGAGWKKSTNPSPTHRRINTLFSPFPIPTTFNSAEKNILFKRKYALCSYNTRTEGGQVRNLSPLVLMASFINPLYYHDVIGIHTPF